MCSTCGCAHGGAYVEGDRPEQEAGFNRVPFSSGFSGSGPLVIGPDVAFHPAGGSQERLNASLKKQDDQEAFRRRTLEIELDVLSKNSAIASHNRRRFAEKNQLVLNLVSSPGSGKTTLLTETLKRLHESVSCAVIEGDQQTLNDAARIRATGTPAIQVNTGKGCHLNADMVNRAAQRLMLKQNGILFIENVGNLVCPADFDLGERHKVTVLSVTEGEDKPLKYSYMFAASSIMLLNKIDLLPYIHFDIDKCFEYARSVNPDIKIMPVSAASGEGMDAWISWLEAELCA